MNMQGSSPFPYERRCIFHTDENRSAQEHRVHLENFNIVSEPPSIILAFQQRRVQITLLLARW